LNNPSSQEDFALLRELENIEKRQSTHTSTNKLAKKNLAKVYGKANFSISTGLPPKSAAGISRNNTNKPQIALAAAGVGSYSKFHLA
jgi:hypothetical protein